MKKALSLILALCVVLSALSLTAAAAEKDRAATDAFYAKKLAYDVDGDGAVSLDDVRLVLCTAAGVIEADEESTADVDGDGAATTLDALAVLRMECGIDPFYTEEDVVNYLASELNWVKSARPGFTRKTEEKCTSLKVTASGAPALIGSFNATDMEYKDYLAKNKTLFKLILSDEEYNEIMAQAEAVYEPKVAEKTVAKGSSHITFFPVNGKGYACKFGSDNELTEYKSITFKENSTGTATITLTMKDYTYPDGSYPYKNLASIPYGQAFNLPALKDVENMNLKSGKIVCVIDTKTGGINTVDYSYTYVATVSAGDSIEGYDFDMTEKMTVKYTEHYDINPVTE